MPLAKGTEVIFSFCIVSNDPDLLSSVEFNRKTELSSQHIRNGVPEHQELKLFLGEHACSHQKPLAADACRRSLDSPIITKNIPILHLSPV